MLKYYSIFLKESKLFGRKPRERMGATKKGVEIGCGNAGKNRL
jgi:hypothetical protein